MKGRTRPLPDYYAILGVAASASLEEIKSAYRRLLKEFHPDLFQSYAEKNKNGEKVKVIIEAFRVLSSAQDRRQYDQKWESSREAPIPPVSTKPFKPSSQTGDWFLWVGGIATVLLAICITLLFLPANPWDRPFRTMGIFLLLFPGNVFFSFMAVSLTMFLFFLIIEGVRYGLEVGTEDVQRDSSILKKKLFTRMLVVFFVSMALGYSYFEWENPLLKIVAGIGFVVLGYGFLFVPV